MNQQKIKTAVALTAIVTITCGVVFASGFDTYQEPKTIDDFSRMLLMDSVSDHLTTFDDVSMDMIDRYEQTLSGVIDAKRLARLHELTGEKVTRKLKYPFYAVFDEGVSYSIANNLPLDSATIAEKGEWLCSETEKVAKEFGVKRGDIEAIINKETFGGVNVGKQNPFEMFQNQIASDNEWNQKKHDKTWRIAEYPSTKDWDDARIDAKNGWYWDPQGQLDSLKKITDKLHLDPTTLRSSSAGALGIVQVMPKSLLNVWDKMGEVVSPFDPVQSRRITAFLIRSYGATDKADFSTRREAFRYYNSGYSKNADGTLQGGGYADDVLTWAEVYNGDANAPFGYPLEQKFGSGLAITAGFHDTSYLTRFGIQHEGLDFAYSTEMYSTVSAENSFSDIHSTLDGFAIVADMPHGWGTNVTVCSMGNVVSTCVIVAHMQKAYLKNLSEPTKEQTDIANGVYGKYASKTKIIGVTKIKVGQLIGQMGTTGYSTKEHTHYQIDRKIGDGEFTPVNPLGFYAKVVADQFRN